jgi:hypothetical protein
MHRWVWELHYPSPDSVRHEYPIAAIPGDTPRYPLGPTALPGSYTARLTANGKAYTAPLTIKMDPRLQISPASLERKFQVETRLASLLTDTSKAVMQAASLHDPLQKLSQQATGPIRDKVQAFQNKIAMLVGPLAGFAAPPTDAVTLARVSAQVASLYGQVWQVDAEPTQSQLEAVAPVERDASDALQRWDTFKTADLPAFNRELHGANLPELHIASDSHKEESGMDEE